ncbi:MAG: hypothetical protein WAK33_18980 [Silvibacterium sp.]
MRHLRKTKLHSVRWIVLALLIGCCVNSWASSRSQAYNLPLPRTTGTPEELIARVSVGPLKRDLRIIVRIRNGEIAGTISPYGAQARQGPAVYTIPIPASAAQGDDVLLLVEVEQKGAETRPPTAQEVQGIKLAYVPVTQSETK